MIKKWIVGVVLLSCLFPGQASSVSGWDKKEEVYSDVFADYFKIIESINLDGPEALADKLEGNSNKGLSYWTIVHAGKASDKLVYSFYDVDGNGIEELVVGSRIDSELESEVDPLVLYTVKDDRTRVLAESSESKNGTSRSDFVLLKDGNLLQTEWFQSKGGKAYLYEIDPKTGGLSKRKEEKFQEKGETGLSLFGYSEDSVVPLDSLEWRSMSQF